MILFYLFILFVIVQRIIELKISSANRNAMLNSRAVEFDREGYKYIVSMHVLFFFSLIAEYNFLGHFNHFSFFIFIIFLLAQFFRYWAIKSLGKNWNTRILVLKGNPLIEKGPYKYFKHPNYFAVIIEFLTIPLIFSLYYTGILFSILNLFVVIRRVKIENKAFRYFLVK